MVLVADGAGEVIGWGAVNMTSIFRVRVFMFRDDNDNDNDNDNRNGHANGNDGGDSRDCDLEALVYQRLAAAIRLR